MNAEKLLPLIGLALLLGHVVSGEHSPLRMFTMRVFARHIEVPLLHLVYLACVGRLRFLSKFFLTRWLIMYPITYPFGHYGDTGRPVPTPQLLEMIDSLEGPIAVGPCRCRMGHRACGHPLETDIVIRTGTQVWLDAFPFAYRTISKDEAKEIVSECASQGLFHMVFLHCLLAGAMNEYVICNCCTDGCVPYILNRSLGQDVYPLVAGVWEARVDATRCERCGHCVEVCPFSARELGGAGPRVLECFGCGLCAAGCKAGASNMELR